MEMVADARITLGHYRVTMVVSYHDRMSIFRNGQGCYRARQKLADMVTMSLTHFTNLLNDLIAWGYLTIERHPSHRNTSTYRVTFGAGDTGVRKTTSASPRWG